MKYIHNLPKNPKYTVFIYDNALYKWPIATFTDFTLAAAFASQLTVHFTLETNNGT